MMLKLDHQKHIDVTSWRNNTQDLVKTLISTSTADAALVQFSNTTRSLQAIPHLSTSASHNNFKLFSAESFIDACIPFTYFRPCWDLQANIVQSFRSSTEWMGFHCLASPYNWSYMQRHQVEKYGNLFAITFLLPTNQVPCNVYPISKYSNTRELLISNN